MRHLALCLVPALAMVAGAAATDQSLKLEFDELSARASAAIDAVNSMEDRARAGGYALAPDLIAQRSLVQSAMDAAEGSLRAKDLERLKERLQRARGLIEHLYRML